MNCKRIAYLRKKLGIRQKEFAKMLQVTPSAVSQWENGRTTPDISLIPQIAELLGTTVSDLMGESQPEHPVIRDEDIKFALFGGDAEITDAQFEEVKRFAQFVKMREEREELGHKQ